MRATIQMKRVIIGSGERAPRILSRKSWRLHSGFRAELPTDFAFFLLGRLCHDCDCQLDSVGKAENNSEIVEFRRTNSGKRATSHHIGRVAEFP